MALAFLRAGKKLTRDSISCLLVASLALLPVDAVRADTITTERALGSTTQAYRQAVLKFLSRSDVEHQLRSLGVERKFAEARVAAMTDEEIQALAGKLESLPSGGQMAYGGGGGGAAGAGVFVLVIVLVAFLIWWLTTRDETHPKS